MIDIGSFIRDWWGLILFCLGLIGALIKQYFDVKQMKEELNEIKENFKKHDEMDAKTAEDLARLTDKAKEELTNLIVANKDDADKSRNHTQDKLEVIGKDMAIVKYQLDLILKNSKLDFKP